MVAHGGQRVGGWLRGGGRRWGLSGGERAGDKAQTGRYQGGQWVGVPAGAAHEPFDASRGTGAGEGERCLWVQVTKEEAREFQS